jgi:adenosylcobinamide kinase/adenosylcobinamide-phosphate guanylyltransferase
MVEIEPGPFPHLVIGGANSGKSRFAEQLLATQPPPFFYVATAQVTDPEMAARIAAHQARRDARWHTVEAPRDLVPTLQDLASRGRPVLVDCLTVWLSNLLVLNSPHSARQALLDLCALVPGFPYPLVLVTSEVGAGIVPDHVLARQFRELAGNGNQQLAAVCAAVTLVVAGLPVFLKPPGPPMPC